MSTCAVLGMMDVMPKGSLRSSAIAVVVVMSTSMLLLSFLMCVPGVCVYATLMM